MMSDFPGETTKQILSAPAISIRSSRYSPTARGRSIPSSKRLPTGSNSLENASGLIRLPEPAAGMMPHIFGLDSTVLRDRTRGSFQCLLQLLRAHAGGMIRQSPLIRGASDARQLFRGHFERLDRVLAGPRHQNFLTGNEEFLQAGPVVTQDGYAAERRFKQAARRTVPHFGHRAARHIERQWRRAV